MRESAPAPSRDRGARTKQQSDSSDLIARASSGLSARERKRAMRESAPAPSRDRSASTKEEPGRNIPASLSLSAPTDNPESVQLSRGDSSHLSVRDRKRLERKRLVSQSSQPMRY